MEIRRWGWGSSLPLRFAFETGNIYDSKPNYTATARLNRFPARPVARPWRPQCVQGMVSAGLPD